jgi:hypothetical protein
MGRASLHRPRHSDQPVFERKIARCALKIGTIAFKLQLKYD